MDGDVFFCVPGGPAAGLLRCRSSRQRRVAGDPEPVVDRGGGADLEKIGCFLELPYGSGEKIFEKSEIIFKKPLCNGEKMGYNR